MGGGGGCWAHGREGPLGSGPSTRVPSVVGCRAGRADGGPGGGGSPTRGPSGGYAGALGLLRPDLSALLDGGGGGKGGALVAREASEEGQGGGQGGQGGGGRGGPGPQGSVRRGARGGAGGGGRGAVVPREASEGGQGGRGVWDPKVCVPKLADQIFPTGNFVVSPRREGGPGGGYPALLRRCTAVVIQRCVSLSSQDPWSRGRGRGVRAEPHARASSEGSPWTSSPIVNPRAGPLQATLWAGFEEDKETTIRDDEHHQHKSNPHQQKDTFKRHKRR